VFAGTFGITRAPSVVDLHINADDPAQLLQALLECRYACRRVLIVPGYGAEHPDAPHPLGLLRARRARPRRRCTAEDRDELAPFPASIAMILSRLSRETYWRTKKYHGRLLLRFFRNTSSVSRPYLSYKKPVDIFEWLQPPL
jgi:hypothetical protein